jgi:glycosyltransferase involved in cell wall biosynthesis
MTSHTKPKTKYKQMNYPELVIQKSMDKERYKPKKPTEIVIAALNEERGIGPTILELTNIIQTNKILLIDGNSNDRTVEVAEKYGAKIYFQDGKGKGNAVTKATKCLEKDTEYVIITDADYTYPAEHLPKMIQILEEKPTVGMVCGNRFHKRPKEDASQNKFYYGNKLLALPTAS